MKDRKIDRERIFADRKRTNVLRNAEQILIPVLLRLTPQFISPNMMTGLGLFGSLMVSLSFFLSANSDRLFILLGILGLIINWIGDSLDGRLAYFRQIERKWYGFALDIIVDWIGIVLIGLGYYFYAQNSGKVLAFLFVVLYGWSMIISLLRYKILCTYQIDSGILGPTELRIIIAGILVLEYFVQGSITYTSIATTIILLGINISDTIKLLKSADKRDKIERKE